jgi:hypothetical protein
MTSSTTRSIRCWRSSVRAVAALPAQEGGERVADVGVVVDHEDTG